MIQTGATKRELGTRRQRSVYSFEVDSERKFAYQGYHLAQSLLRHCAVDPSWIHVNATHEVTVRTRAVFTSIGCHVNPIERIGDGRFCNKIAQLSHLKEHDFDLVVLLDTDTIVIADPRPHLDENTIQAKIVDFSNPSMIR